MKYVLALDQGTTSSRAAIVGEDGKIVCILNREFPQIYPREGWVEHDPEDILNTQITALQKAVELSGVEVQDIAAIGYISLGSMDASVKALKVARNPEDGAEAVYVEATPENVASGDYAIARPFNIAYKADSLSATAQDFINWILSAEGQAIVTAQKYVAKEPAEYQAAPVAGKIVIGGSSSVGPLMQKLEEAYEELHPEVDIEVQISDSSTGMHGAADGSFDIGMASREVKASELEAGLTPVPICMDGIAVIVNNDNAVEGLTLNQIRDIFTGEIVDWDEVK